MCQISLALHTIGYYFGGRFDKQGRPYVTHLMRVWHRIESEFKDDELGAIALLHDIIEDIKGVTYTTLRELGFTERVIEGVRCLTKVPGETYEEYLARVESNFDAVCVKLCDLTDNSDLTRLKGVEQKDLDRMNKYVLAFDRLYRIKMAHIVR